MAQLSTVRKVVQRAYALGGGLMDFHELMTAPAEKILSRWFESEPLKSTLATDAIIGAMLSPKSVPPPLASSSRIEAVTDPSAAVCARVGCRAVGMCCSTTSWERSTAGRACGPTSRVAWAE